MKPIIEKYIGIEAYQKVIDSFDGNQEFAEVFTDFLEKFITELETDDQIHEEDTPATLLEIPLMYIKPYTENRIKGFSKLWSDAYAIHIIDYSIRNIMPHCYLEVSMVDKETAMKDLDLYCELSGKGKLYTDYLIDAVINIGWHDTEVEKRATDYVRMHNLQIKNGKSETFALKYAQLMADEEYHEVYCEEYAFMYDESLCKGKCETYAELYADKYAEAMVNIKARTGIHDNEEIIDFAKSRVKAFMNAWEYASNNRLENSKLFIENYQNTYSKILFSDNSTYKDIEEVEKIALKNALEMHEKK